MLENYSDFVEENCVFVDVGCLVGGTTVWGLVCLGGSAIRASACLQLATDHNMKDISLSSDVAVVVNDSIDSQVLHS
jgi:hypothetical protein